MGSSRSRLVLDDIGIELQRVDVLSRIGLAEFHVQMRAEGISLIPRQGKDLALLQREAVRAEGQVHGKGLVLVLISLHYLLHFGHELVQMSVYRCIAIIMRDVYRLSVSSGSHRHPADVSVGNAPDGLTYHPLRLEVHSPMEMVGTEFPEVPAQQQGKIEG